MSGRKLGNTTIKFWYRYSIVLLLFPADHGNENVKKAKLQLTSFLRNFMYTVYPYVLFCFSNENMLFQIATMEFDYKISSFGLYHKQQWCQNLQKMKEFKLKEI